MNEPRPHLNESESEDKMIKKGTKCYLYQQGTMLLGHKNYIVKHVLFGVILYVGWPHVNFFGMNVREDKVYYKDSCWSMEIAFTLRSEEKVIGSLVAKFGF